MKAYVFSISKVSESDMEKIKGILQESECKNESLSNTFKERYHGFVEKGNDGYPIVYLDGNAEETKLASFVEY